MHHARLFVNLENGGSSTTISFFPIKSQRSSLAMMNCANLYLRWNEWRARNG
jgi:hypothetical protein